jgi:pSer/pThr/pTyr-binding forkhead associated (FHA) protein
MKLSLVVRSPGKMEGQAISVRSPQFLIGRDPQCQLRPSSNLISNRHCALITRDEKVYVRDLVSTNGTFVNGNKIQGEVELVHEDQITLGPLHFTVVLEQTAPVSVGVGKKPNDDVENEAATLLLGLGDGDGSVPKSEAPTSTDIPSGTTVLNIPGPAAAPGSDDGKEAPSKLDQVKQAQADTSSAASAILNKYLRRR